MARHHIRDEKGNLHFFNDEEYKQYKFNKGCYGVLALLVFAVGGLLNKCNNKKETSTETKIEKIVNTDALNSTKEGDNTSEMNILMDKLPEVEESDNIETQNQIEETEELSQEESYFNEVFNEESVSENNDESYSIDMKTLKKQQKEERKRLKQLEKEAKRKAKEEVKKAKRKAKEKDNQ